MLCKRIIPCLDVKNNRVVKGTSFLDLSDAGDPVELAKRYYAEGADELIFLDISATIEGRKTMVNTVKKVAKEIFIPFTVGGGISSLDDMYNIFRAGADKISLNTVAVQNPNLISRAAKMFGSQSIVVAIDAKQEARSWKVYIKGGTVKTPLDAIEWAKKAVSLGAGEVLLTSIDRDGTKKGFDLDLTNTVSNTVNVPVIASGGAGSEKDFLDVFENTKATAALAASLFHYNMIKIPKLKKYLGKNGVEIREN
ncbi:imidazole glycerol phosphate synthase subunit HisF [Candidatus Micrarchaeota archaeon]|nr:imidazole glycerol phosphate synthase subunit HisF [Candidatus Micrarchaeota archaeon]